MFRRAFIALLLFLSTAVHAQIVTCTDSVQAQPYTACTHTANAATPANLMLWCGSGTAPSSALASCSVATWQQPGWFQSYSWTWTVQGWQRFGSMVFTVPAPPPPPVVTPGNGSVILAWVAPLKNDDGTPLTDLAGYRIYNGTSPTALTQFLSISNPAANGTTILGLAAGTWYFAVSSFNSAGGEGLMSPVVSKTITATTPAPVACVVSDWSTWAGGPWSACANGSQNRSEMHTRTVATAAANGGAACPVLMETRNAVQPCGTPWKVAPNGTSTVRPLYEAVLPVIGTALVRGNQEGAVAVGKPCGPEIVKSGNTSYRTIADADAQLSSQTYRGRNHIAVCVVSP